MALVSGLSLLIVEDDADSRELLEISLLAEGARVRVATTAAEARSAIRTELPDVLLLDITLPDEDGFSLLATLRADPATRDVRAVALTGHADDLSRTRALDAGFQRHIAKPIDIFALPAVIASVVRPGKALR